ncbi:HK97 family phage prohead protease [Streptomyces sp. 891-h]|uniref:HK97 family phage prohead protease n=1 Tax=Streptomyces sp. 891-h TaxID=2720714 RepID=UPI001FAA05EA|nr:HK97 family phage prohead protease [Streptomyces sp. 891-h]UNZ20619.1 HK97 family phage prohead protease [Streptomyces sp. 891-h]
MVDRRDLLDVPERRAIRMSGGLELRAGGDGLKLTGYASVFESPYEVYGGPPLGWTEIVDKRAFDTTLAAKPDLHLLINHEGMPLARTKSGTLRLAADKTGLHVEAELDAEDPDVQRLRSKMSRGDMDEMSFGFRVKRQEWNDDYSERRLTEISLHKGDVSVVNFGANPATSAQMNSASALEVLAGMEPDAAMAELRSGGVIDLEQLTRARDTVIALHRSARPTQGKRRLSVAEARALEADGSGEVRLAAAIPTHRTPVVDGDFERLSIVREAPADPTTLRYMHAWVDPQGDPQDKKSYRFAHHEGRIGAPANLSAVRYALSRLPHQTDMTDEQIAEAEAHLRRHLADAD